MEGDCCLPIKRNNVNKDCIFELILFYNLDKIVVLIELYDTKSTSVNITINRTD